MGGLGGLPQVLSKVSGTQVLSWGVPQSQVRFPRSFPEGATPVPGSFPGLWSQVLSQGCTPVLTRKGYPSPGLGVLQSQPGGYPMTGLPPPQPGQNWSTPQPGQDWGTPWPGQDWVTPPPPPLQSGMGYPLARTGVPLGQNWGNPPTPNPETEHLMEYLLCDGR